MKLRVDVDATPEELRRFFGLPDVQPLNEELVDTLRRRMAEGVEGYDPMSLMSRNASTLETLQQLFWSSFANAASGTPSHEGDDDAGDRGQ